MGLGKRGDSESPGPSPAAQALALGTEETQAQDRCGAYLRCRPRSRPWRTAPGRRTCGSRPPAALRGGQGTPHMGLPPGTTAPPGPEPGVCHSSCPARSPRPAPAPGRASELQESDTQQGRTCLCPWPHASCLPCLPPPHSQSSPDRWGWAWAHATAGTSPALGCPTAPPPGTASPSTWHQDVSKAQEGEGPVTQGQR